MIADLLNRRSLGSLTSLHDDSLSNFNDAFTIYGHPKVKDILKAFELLQVIQLPNYRTALKLRAIQRKMQLHRVDAREIMNVLEQSELPPLSEEIGEAEMEPVINEVCFMAERNADTTIVSCADLVLTWILQLFDSNFIGAVKVKQFTTALVIMGSGRLLDKLKYLFDTFKDGDGVLTQQGFSELLTDLLLIPCSVFEEEIYGHSSLVLSAIFECFNQFGNERQRLSLDEFLHWCTKSPFCLSWLFTFHRLMSSEYSVNLTSCSNCGTAPFLGFRYVALHKYTVAICQECLWTGNCEESEFREFGALSQCVNVTVVPMRTVGSTTSVANSNTLSQVQQCLDKRHEMLLSYSKRLDPKSTSQFVPLYETLQTKDDNVEALMGECEDAAAKLQREFHALSREHCEILKLERKDNENENFIAWKKRDDMSSKLAVWMSRRNDLFMKEETLLQMEEVPFPTLSYNKFGPLGSLQSLASEDISRENSLHMSMNGLDKMAPKVSVEDSVMVLSKLSLIINNALLQKSFSSTPSKPLKQLSRDTPPLSPLSFENKAVTGRITNGANGTNGLSKENLAHNAPSSQDESAMTSSEKDVMQEFENTVNDIMIQENLIRAPRKIISLHPEAKERRASASSPLEAIAEVDLTANKVPVTSDNISLCLKPDLGPLSSENESLRNQPVQSELRRDLANEEKSVNVARPCNGASAVMDKEPISGNGAEKNVAEGSKLKPLARSSPVAPRRSMLPVLKTQLSTPSIPSKCKVTTTRIPVACSRKVINPEPTSIKDESPAGSLSDVTAGVRTSLPDVTTDADKEEVKEEISEKEESAVQEACGEVKVTEGSENPTAEDEVVEEEEEWESEGSWETEEENTVSQMSQPPDTLDIGGVVSEPECDPPDLAEQEQEEDPADSAPPIPPPRSLLSPQGVARRATSLKTKSEGDPRMEELRKVTRASSSVHTKSKPSGIPLRTTPTTPSSMLPGAPLSSSPSNTPPPRQHTSRIPTPRSGSTPDVARLVSTPSSTPEILSRISDNSARSTPEGGAGKVPPRVAPRRGGKPPASKLPSTFKGPIVYEGESDSETSTSSSSSSDDDKKSKFTRARSARFARSKTTTPNRNAASFRTKKGSSKNQQPLEFFNNFAE